MAKVRTRSGATLDVGRVGEDVQSRAQQRSTGERVHYIDPATGRAMSADAADMAAVEGTIGAPVERVTEREAIARETAAAETMRREYGPTDVGGALRAGVVGAGSGVMDVVLAAPKLATSAYAAATGEADPLADVTGRTGLAGIAYTLGELGGASAAENAATFERSMGEQRRLATEHGTATAAGRVLGEALPLLATGGLAGAGRLGSRIAIGAAEGMIGGVAATEEDAFLAGRSPAALGDRIAGGLMGAVLGGGLVGAGALASPLMRRAGSATDALAARVFGAADGAAGGGLRGRAADMADDLTLRHLHEGRTALVRKLGDDPAARRRIGRILRENEVVGTGDYAEIAQRADALAQKAGGRMRGALEELDGVGARVDGAALRSRIASAADEFTSPTQTRSVQALGRRMQIEAEQIVKRAEAGELTFAELHQFRTNIDANVRWAAKGGGPPGADVMYKRLRGVVEDSLQEQADAVGGRALAGANDNGAWSASWRAAKEEYRAAAWARDAAEEQIERSGANRVFSLTDNLQGAAGLAAGLASGSLGAGVLTGAAAGLANKAFRKYAVPVSAAIADRVARGTDNAISGAVGSFFARAGRSTGEVGRALRAASPALAAAPRVAATQVAFAGPGEDDAAAYARRAAQLAQVSSNPAALEARIQASLGDLPRTAPRTAAAVAMRQRQAVAFLAQKVPAALNSPGVTPQLFQPRVQPSELAKFKRYWQGVADPRGTIEGIGEGRISREGVEALRICYPEMYAETQAQMMAGLAALDRPLPARQAVELEIIMDLGGAAWPMLAPGALAAQASVSATVTQQQAKGGAPTRVVRIAQQYQTASTGGLRT